MNPNQAFVENGKKGAKASAEKYLSSDARKKVEEKKAKVRAMRDEGMTIQQIADAYGVAYTTMRRFCTVQKIGAAK